MEELQFLLNLLIWHLLVEIEAYHLEAISPGSMLRIIPNQSNLTS